MAKFDAYEMVTDKIIAMLEQGIIPWEQPWGCSAMAWSGNSGKAYSFLNQLLLADPGKKYKSMQELTDDIRGEYVTFKQAQERGGSVKKGEHGKKVVFFKMMEKKNDDGEVVERWPMLKAYTVFRIDQCEGLEQKYNKDNDVELNVTAEEVAQGYIDREGITYEMGGNSAYYRPSEDKVVTPKPEQFKSAEEYYCTLFHELTHSTGHEKRLNRITKNAAFGSEDYSTEELVAEIGSASILATLGMENHKTLKNSAAYIQNWLMALRNDKKMVVVAAGRAEKAIKMVLGVA